MGTRRTNQPDRKWPQSFKDYDGREVVLTKERWAHIIAGHPEMADWIEWVGVTLATPNVVYQSEENVMRISYSHLLPKIGFYVTVITDWSNEPATVRTAFATKKLKKGKLIYVRKPDPVV